MANVSLRSLRFRNEREATWLQLEDLLKRLERSSAAQPERRGHAGDPSLYRATLSSLSVARATSLDLALIEYLEALCARAYFFVYGARTTFMQRIGDFFAHSWPQRGAQHVARDHRRGA